ncbi:MAG: hypothetical protein MZV70_23080 [Desulfobacterales bacterium]|nr:hypothetical protein [Desulfobacterales bacterium]
MTNARIIFSLFTLMIMVSSSAYAMSGRDVFEKVHELRARMLDQKTEATMVLYDRGGGSAPARLQNTAKTHRPKPIKPC